MANFNFMGFQQLPSPNFEDYPYSLGTLKIRFMFVQTCVKGVVWLHEAITGGR